MFNRKIEVYKIINELYSEANRYAEWVLNVSKEELDKEFKIFGIEIKSISDDYLSGRLDGYDKILEVLSDFLDKDDMLDKKEKDFIEVVEENIKQALIIIKKRSKYSEI